MASDERIWTAGLLIIGDEILSGRTQDKNIAQIATWLNLQGIRRFRGAGGAGRQGSDRRGRWNALRAANDYLFTTGGIGPTHDDITVDAIAEALGVAVVVHPKARAVLEDYYASRGGISEARLRMARVPEGAELIENRMSGAPGIRFGNIFILAWRAAYRDSDAGGAVLDRSRVAARSSRARSAAGRPRARCRSCLRRRRKRTRVSNRQLPVLPRGRVGANFVVRSSDEAAWMRASGILSQSSKRAGAPWHRIAFKKRPASKGRPEFKGGCGLSKLVRPISCREEGQVRQDERVSR
jgi:hypothetical protein